MNDSSETRITKNLLLILEDAKAVDINKWIIESISKYKTQIKTKVTFNSQNNNINFEIYPYFDDEFTKIQLAIIEEQRISSSIPFFEFFEKIHDSDFAYNYCEIPSSEYPDSIKANIISECLLSLRDILLHLVDQNIDFWTPISEISFGDNLEDGYILRFIPNLKNDSDFRSENKDSFSMDGIVNNSDEYFFIDLIRKNNGFSFSTPKIHIDSINKLISFIDTFIKAAETLDKFSCSIFWDEGDEILWEVEFNDDIPAPNNENVEKITEIYRENNATSEESQKFTYVNQDPEKGVMRLSGSRRYEKFEIQKWEKCNRLRKNKTIVKVSGSSVYQLEFNDYVHIDADIENDSLFISTKFYLYKYSLNSGQFQWKRKVNDYSFKINKQDKVIDIGASYGMKEKFALRLDYDGKTLEKNPSNVYEMIEWAEKAAKKRHYGKAIEYYLKSIDDVSDYRKATIYRNLGEIFEELSEPEKAIYYYEKALEANIHAGVKKRLKELKN